MWERLSFNDEEVSFVGRHRSPSSNDGVLVLRRISSEEERRRAPVPVYVPNTLWGNTFCQKYRVGAASYHFLPSNNNDDEQQQQQQQRYEAYISYEHPSTSEWCCLGDGSPIPDRVPFHNVEWDETNRTFRGTIKWSEDYGSAWHGCREWRYEMTFSLSYTFVASGTCDVYGEDGGVGVDVDVDAPYITHQFGEDLVYVNACAKDWYHERTTTTTTPRPTNEVEALRLCQAEGASVLTQHEMHVLIFPSRAVDKNS